MTKIEHTLRPYKGLFPYSDDDAMFFFGREAERKIVTANLLASRLTVLYGPSGVGKTSLLHAGVAHHLREIVKQNLAKLGTPKFAVVVFSSWRDDPVIGLANCAQNNVSQMLNNQTMERTSSPRALDETLMMLTEQIQGELLIILDQFEEYFLYHDLEEDEGSFIAQFSRTVNNSKLRVSFLISIREDWLARLDRFKGRIPNLFNNYLRINYLDREAGRAAIEKPIEAYNQKQKTDYSIEPKLVEAILKNVKSRNSGSDEEEIEMSNLQLFMTRLWGDDDIQSGSRVLRLKTWNRLGGAGDIMQEHLDTALNALSSTEQDIAVRVFDRLISPSGIKTAHNIHDSAEWADSEKPLVISVLKKLSGAENRVLRVVAPPSSQSATPYYEIFNDTLASKIVVWRERHLLAQDRTKTDKKFANDRQLAQERWSRFKWRMGMFVELVVVIILSIFAINQRNNAKNTLSYALALNATSQLTIDPELSVMLAAEAVRTSHTSQAEEALRAALLESHLRAVMREHRNSIKQIAFSPDGKWIVTASVDSTARVWEASTGRSIAILQGHTGSVNSANFSPDGAWVVTASDDGTARIWKVSTGQTLIELRGHTREVLSATFSTDGKLVVTSSRDNTARVWKSNTGQSMTELRGHTDIVRSAAFSLNGERVVTASLDKTARVWEVGTGRAVSELRGHNAGVNSAEFHPDGEQVVTASLDNTARVWKGDTIIVLRGHTGVVRSARFSPDGNWIVTSSHDNTARVWDANSGGSVAQLLGHTNSVISAVFSPDGRFVVTASEDRTARVWEARTGRTVAELRGHTGSVNSVAFSSDGKRVVTAGDDRTARVWEPLTNESLMELRGHTASITSAVFSPDGKWILTAGDSTARIWEASTGRSLTELRGKSWVVSAAFSPDSRFVTTASMDSTARVWDVNTGRIVTELRGHTDSVSSAEFSPSGNLLATASLDSTARIWNMSTERTVVVLKGHRGRVNSVAFSPDSRRVVTASEDRTARVWETTMGRSIIELRGHTDGVIRANFSPDGRWVVTASRDATARLWEVSTGRNILELRGHTGAVNSATFSRNGRWIITTGWDCTARVWEATTGRSVEVLRGHTAPVTNAAFSPDGEFVVTASWDCTAQIYACEVCGSIENLLALARARVTRGLTSVERERYLHEPKNK